MKKNTSNKKHHIIIISTGGTIEKTYDEADGSLENRGTVISDFMEERLRLPHTSFEIRSIMSKDSLYMTEEDRQVICDNINFTLEKKCPVVVLHGTDTIMKSLAYCEERIKHPSQAVIFTGAMKPLEFEKSDGLQNLTEALILTRALDPGFYLVFHSNIYKAHGAEKNYKTLTFDPIII